MKGVVSILAVVAATGLLAAGGAGASGINGINNGMPNRISMNVTVPKQTQGASFGEKVSGGLQAAGSAVAQGASLSLVVECGQAACAIAFPDGDGYRADTTRMTLQPSFEACLMSRSNSAVHSSSVRCRFLYFLVSSMASWQLAAVPYCCIQPRHCS